MLLTMSVTALTSWALASIVLAGPDSSSSTRNPSSDRRSKNHDKRLSKHFVLKCLWYGVLSSCNSPAYGNLSGVMIPTLCLISASHFE